MVSATIQIRVIHCTLSYGFFCPMPPHIFVDFLVLPPGHGRSVTYFWGWDALEAQLRCRDNVSGDIGGRSARRTLKPKFYQPTQTMVTAGILPFRENSHGRAGNRTRDLMVTSQRLWPLDREAGRHCLNVDLYYFKRSKDVVACPSGRAVYGVGLRPPACWDCMFESHRGHGCMSVVRVVCSQVEVSATGWSRVQRNPIDFGASLCVI